MTEIVGFDFAARIRGIALKLGSCKRGKYFETFFGLVCCHLQFFGKKDRTTIQAFGCNCQITLHSNSAKLIIGRVNLLYWFFHQFL